MYNNLAKLPLEHSLNEALKIYLDRLYILLKVGLITIFLWFTYALIVISVKKSSSHEFLSSISILTVIILLGIAINYILTHISLRMIKFLSSILKSNKAKKTTK